MKNLDDRAFLSPRQVQARFGLSRSEYTSLVQRGLPTYYCAEVTRHPIGEIYQWCENNRIVLRDQNDLCTRTQLKKLLNINESVLSSWEKAGLPYCERRGVDEMKHFIYNKYDVIDWLKSQQNNVLEV